MGTGLFCLFVRFERGANDFGRPSETALVVALASFAPDNHPKSVHCIPR